MSGKFRHHHLSASDILKNARDEALDPTLLEQKEDHSPNTQTAEPSRERRVSAPLPPLAGGRPRFSPNQDQDNVILADKDVDSSSPARQPTPPAMAPHRPSQRRPPSGRPRRPSSTPCSPQRSPGVTSKPDMPPRDTQGGTDQSHEGEDVPVPRQRPASANERYFRPPSRSADKPKYRDHPADLSASHGQDVTVSDGGSKGADVADYSGANEMLRTLRLEREARASKQAEG